MKKLRYEPEDAEKDYTIEKTYVPDFVGKDGNILYEAKGRFRTRDEAVKYLWVRTSNPEVTIRFIFSDPNNRAYPQVKMTMAQWAEKYGFEWCSVDNIPKHWKEDK